MLIAVLTHILFVTFSVPFVGRRHRPIAVER